MKEEGNNMSKKAMLLDYQWCTGCHSCEMACQMEHGYENGRCGIVVSTIGPWNLGDGKWQYDNVVGMTALCDLCAERAALGKEPSCVQHCQAHALKVGDAAELAAEAAAGPKKILIVA